MVAAAAVQLLGSMFSASFLYLTSMTAGVSDCN